jgi:hypothetical protein
MSPAAWSEFGQALGAGAFKNLKKMKLLRMIDPIHDSVFILFVMFRFHLRGIC